MPTDKKIALWLGFRSQINSSNARVPSLLGESFLTETVLIDGFKSFKLDRAILWLLKIYKRTLFQLVHRKYKWVHIMDPDEIPGRRFNQVLHLDDPTFSNEERAQIRAWFLRLKKGDRKGMVVVTFKEAELYIRSIDSEIATCIIEQGYTELENRPEKFERFSFVYSSPYIDYKGDKHAHHPSWSAIHLLEDIIPYIIEKYKEVEIHLIGRLGENARSYVSKFENVVCHGLVCPRKNAFLLSKCHIALYPRVQDMKRRVLKVSEYMGAEIPVIAYRQEDTNLVSEFGTGLLAEDYLEFISNINLLYFDSALREQITARIKKAKEGRSWKELGKTLDKAIELHTSKYQF